MTRNGVEYNLNDSKFIYLNENGIKFYFSSIFYLSKFKQKLKENRKYINESLNYRFKINNLNLTNFCDLILYNKIEKRGFLIESEGNKICQKDNLRIGMEQITMN